MNDTDPTVSGIKPAHRPPDDLCNTPTLAPAVAALFPTAGVPTVPGYEIEGELGRGGMGVVYKARDTRLDRVVALKIVLGGGHAGAAALARFLAEAKAAAAVRHPGIAQVYEFGEHDGLPFFAMEYCPGGSLAEKLTGTPLPPEQAADLVERIADAMQAAHTAGIVHRDLKPANILLQVDSGLWSVDRKDNAPVVSSLSSVHSPPSTPTPKVSDFGLARRGDSGSGLTATGAVLGSPSYMSPEQAEGKKDIGPAADVYGLGAILYECLTGRPPFRAVTPLETVMQVLMDEVVPPSRLVPKLPRDLETICLKCLQKDPRRRYASAAELADDLRNFREGRPITARPVSVFERGWKAAKRRPGVTAVIGAAALAVAAIVGVVIWKNRELERERDLAQQERDKARLAEETAGAERDKALIAGMEEIEARVQADIQRNRAERHLIVALDAIERMVRMAGEKWARNPALQAERRAVLEDAIAVYRSFSAEDSEDQRVRRQTALAEGRIAAVYMALADYERAGEALAIAETIQSHLNGMFPREPDYPNDLALTLIQRGHTHTLTGQFEAAQKNYTQAAEKARAAITLAGNRDDFKLTLAEALTALGHWHGGRNPEEGIKYHGEALRLAREVSGKPDPGYGGQLFLAVGLLNVGALEINRGQVATGSRMLTEAEKVFDGLAGREAPSARWGEMYDSARAQALVFKGTLLARAGNLEEGLKKIDEGLAGTERLLAVQPKSFSFQMQKLNALSVRIDVLDRLKRNTEARRALAEMAELSEGIAASSPSMAWLRPRFAIQRSQEVVFQARAGEIADLDKRVAEAMARAPTTRDPNPQRNLAADTIRYNMACAYAQAARFGEAADREKFAAKAVAELNALVRDSYFAVPARVTHLDDDTDLDPLRDREDYKQFVAKVNSRPAVAPPPRAVMR